MGFLEQIAARTNAVKQPRHKSRNKMLGLAVGERSILVAEVTWHVPPATGGRRDDDAARASATFQATHLAEFIYPEATTLQQGEQLGDGLAAFLKTHDFTARHAVVGIPAKWVVVKNKQVPPADPRMIADSLRLQAEGDFSPALTDLVYDYAGQTSTTEPRQVLLMATPRRYLDQVLAITAAARVDAVAVCPSAASLGWATNRSSRDAIVLSLGAAGAEFTAQSGPSPCALRHMGPVPSSGPGPMFLSELRRMASLVPPAIPLAARAVHDVVAGSNGKSITPPNGREIVVWNGFSLDSSARQAVGDSLGMPVRAGDLASLGVTATGAATAGKPGHFAPAVALALSGLAGGVPPVDFLHSRLAPPPPRRIDPRLLYGSVSAVAVLLLALIALHSQHREQAILKEDTDRYARMEKDIKLAKSEVAKIGYARGWHSGLPEYLPCLRDLTNAMPDDGQTYLTSFDLHENHVGSLTGKTTSDDNALKVEARLKASAQFKDIVQSLIARESTRNGREVTFTISFRYVGHD